MKYNCPNKDCSDYKKNNFVIFNGSYHRKSDSRIIKRFFCKKCRKHFSSATFSLEKNQKKRRINELLKKLLVSSVSMRRSALILGVSRTTIHRKLIFLSKKARLSQRDFLQSMKKNPITEIQFDDLITFEHTKLKPLAVSIVVDKKKRSILGCAVSQIPAFGKLAKRSVQKYGKRKSNRIKNFKKLLIELRGPISKNAIFESDKDTQYPKLIEKIFDSGVHRRHKGSKSSVTGQGELKSLRFDPLFTLNHSCAMLRANINRLVRKTWSTTKDPKMLKNHLDLFIDYYNQFLLNNPSI